MPSPYDYSINIPDPTQAFTQGMNTGFGIQEMQLKQQQQQVALQQQQQALAQQQQQRDVLNSLLANKNPSADDYARVTLAVPGLREQLKQSFEMRNTEQQQASLKEAGEVHSALTMGRPDVAANILRDRATALQNSGGDPAQIKAAQDMASLVEINPDFVRIKTGALLSSIPGGDKVLTSIQSQAKAPSDIAESQAKASEAQSNAAKAAVAAKFAESNAVTDLQKKGWDITKIQEDIKIARQNAAIAATNAAIARESNGLKRQENQIKLQEMLQKRDEAVRTKAADLESARGNMDNMLNTADRILKTPIGVIGSAAGPVSSRMPTLSQDTADFEALVETLGSQSFLAQIPNIKGMGSLSNAEGEKLQAALQNFSLKQSPERLLENVREAQRLILKARSNMAKRSGLPESVPDTPAVTTSGSDIDALVKKYAGGN